ncbi:EPIDERMAL PATTERNING FACTOR-like protein 4 [Magnolia sinica]|uniref:EPIDERMAL PATTERNING FACTOR-like protein 4 n=1 Tax=Magnolia sinica TaxID=86752 RepID=UPI002659CFFE|nr:EPIDERMAL PATTERNING FACTOR-like protein 4 [Magnolia sinica]
MGAVHPSPTRHRRLSLATALALLFFATLLSSPPSLGSGLTVEGRRLAIEEANPTLGSYSLERFPSRRRLGGPGSSPPTCRSKCGRCSPCKPVHVPIHPGQSIPLEYYPEAWRCKCGNKLFMP